MNKVTLTRVCRGFVYAGVVGLVLPAVSSAAEVTGREVVQHCNYKNPGQDQLTELTIILRDKDGNERKNVYTRLWKDYGGKNDIADKMVLFTQYPPDARGAAFMRWAFTSGAEKNADQWIYLPVLRKIRRVSIRDPGDSFLGSDLTYADISGRSLDSDEHELVEVATRGGKPYYVVESRPKEDDPLYSKRIQWFNKAPSWDSCVKVYVAYFDRKGTPLKEQSLSWQKVEDAWLWKRVEVENVQTGHSSLFEVRDPEVNVGLDDGLFTERSLRRGYRR